MVTSFNREAVTRQEQKPFRAERTAGRTVVLPTRRASRNALKELIMLGWAITFLLVALVAAVLGFGGIANFAVDIAKIIFFVAIVLFVISAVVALIRGRSPTMP
jgi:uncharacterized membrane protein YtjA (UPF0391 family)